MTHAFQVKFEDAATKAAGLVENLGNITGEGVRNIGLRAGEKVHETRENHEAKKELKRLGLYEGKADKLQVLPRFTTFE